MPKSFWIHSSLSGTYFCPAAASRFLPVVYFSNSLCKPQQRRDGLRGVSCFYLLQVKDSQTDGLLQVALGVVGVANERQRQLAADQTCSSWSLINFQLINISIVNPNKEHMCDTHGPAVGSFPPSLPSRTTRFARHADERNVGCVYHQRCSRDKPYIEGSWKS